MTVVLNDPSGLARTIDSLKRQSFKKWEYIVIDGGSSGATLDVIDKYSSMISHQHVGRDDGIYDAMNIGIEMSSGEYLMFMNAGDDFASEDALQGVESFLKERLSVQVLLGGTYQNIGNCAFYRPPKKVGWIGHGLPAFHQSTIYKAELFHARKYDLRYPLLADYAWLASLCVDGVTVGYLNTPVSNFYVGGASYTNLKQKYLDSYNVKYSILGLSKFSSLMISITAILKTVFVMSILQRYCKFISLKPSLSQKYCEENYNVDIEYYKYDSGSVPL